MRHILRLTSSVLLFLVIATSAYAEDNKTKPEAPKSGLSMGIFYNPCMSGNEFSQVLLRTQEVPLMRMLSQQHGPMASVQIFVNEESKSFTIAIMNVQLPVFHPQKICILANGVGFKYLKRLGIQI